MNRMSKRGAPDRIFEELDREQVRCIDLKGVSTDSTSAKWLSRQDGEATEGNPQASWPVPIQLV